MNSPEGRALLILRLLRSWGAYALLPIAGLATAPVLARALGPHGRGELAGVLTPLTLASALAVLGLPSAVTYFIASGASRRHVLHQARWIAALATLTVGVTLLFYGAVVARHLGLPRLEVQFIWIAFLPSAFVSIRRAELQAYRRYSALDTERALGALFRVATILLLFVSAVRAALPYAVAYMAAGLGASLILFLPAWHRNVDRGGANPARGLSQFALLSSLGTIAAAMNSRLDQALMPSNTSARELGYYSVAVAIAEAPLIIATVVGRNVLAEASAGASLKKVYSTIAIGGTVVVVGSGALALILPRVVPLVFGENFGPAIHVAQILLLSTVAQYFADSQAALLTGLRSPGMGSLAAALATIVTVVLFVGEWHRMDATRAAWIAVAAQVASLSISTPVAARRARYRVLHERNTSA